jgi:primosomal protein N'
LNNILNIKKAKGPKRQSTWQMANGKWQMANGKWQMAMASPYRSHSHLPFAISDVKPQPQPKLLILRGAPGSGKTTLCEHRFKKWTRVSADDFFVDANGYYKFDGSQLQHVHDVYFAKAVEVLGQGKDVIVDNTNRAISEFTRYLRIPNVEIKI